MSNSLGQRWCTELSAVCPEKLCIFLLIYPSAFQVHLSSQDVWSQGNWRLVCSTQAKGRTLSTFDVVIVFFNSEVPKQQQSQVLPKKKYAHPLGDMHCMSRLNYHMHTSELLLSTPQVVVFILPVIIRGSPSPCDRWWGSGARHAQRHSGNSTHRRFWRSSWSVNSKCGRVDYDIHISHAQFFRSQDSSTRGNISEFRSFPFVRAVWIWKFSFRSACKRWTMTPDMYRDCRGLGRKHRNQRFLRVCFPLVLHIWWMQGTSGCMIRSPNSCLRSLWMVLHHRGLEFFFGKRLRLVAITQIQMVS